MVRFNVLDSFRGISAISVVVFHIHIVNSLTEWDFFRSAYLFVPFFFCLSAFVLSHSYYSRNFDTLEMRNMLSNRIFRLWPLHITMLLVFIILEGGKLLAESKGIAFTYPAFSGDNSASEILPNLFLIQSWFNSFSDISFNYPAWSISVEMGLYIVLAIILYSMKSLRPFAFVIIAIVTFFILIYGLDHWRKQAYVGLFCFSTGALTYRIYDAINHLRPDNRLMSALEILSLFLVYIVITSNIQHIYIVSTLVFCFTILVFSFEGGIVSSLLKLSPFTFLGKISYSIYMTHAAIIFSATAIFKIASKINGGQFLEMHPIVNAGSDITVTFFNLGSTLSNNGLVLFLLIIVVSISTLTYRFIERPGQKLGKKLTASWRGTDSKPPARFNGSAVNSSLGISK